MCVCSVCDVVCSPMSRLCSCALAACPFLRGGADGSARGIWGHRVTGTWNGLAGRDPTAPPAPAPARAGPGQSLGFPPSPAVFVQMVLRKGHGKHMSEPPIFSISWSVCGASLGTSLPCRGAPSSAFLTFRQSENKKKDYKTKKLKPGNR